MAGRHTYFQSLQSITGAAIVWLGIIGLAGSLDREIPRFSNPLCGAARDGLDVLTAIVPVAWQVLEALELNHRLLECLLQMLLSFEPLLQVVARGIQ